MKTSVAVPTAFARIALLGVFLYPPLFAASIYGNESSASSEEDDYSQPLAFDDLFDSDYDDDDDGLNPVSRCYIDGPLCLPTAFNHYDGNPPDINIKKSSIILQNGADQYFECKSNEPVMWVYSTGMYNWVPPIENIGFQRTSFPILAALDIKNVSAKMVGMYYCVNKQSYYNNRHLTLDRLVHMRQASSIYIYVNDSINALVPIDATVFKVHRHDFFVIPCKPTLPNVEVELYRTNDGDSTQDFVQNCTLSDHGCLLHFGKQEDGGSYFCKAKGKLDHTIHFKVEVIEPSEYLMRPSIHSDIKGSVPIGERIHFECKVNITAGVDLSMEWEMPMQKTLYETFENYIRPGPLKVAPTKDTEHMFTMSGELIIENARQSDTGTYWCKVQDQNGNKNNGTFKLHVRQSDENYVLLREKNNRTNINVHPKANGETPSIDIVFEYRSLPANITFIWMKNSSGMVITVGMDRKYELTHIEKQIRLRINDPSVSDMGNYTLRVMAGIASKEQHIGVYVYAKPVVCIEKSTEGKFMRMGDKVNFTCRATGFPCPDISFQFRQCTTPQRCSVEGTVFLPWHPSNGTDETQIINSGVLTLDATSTGVVYCSANNTEGNDTAQFFVSGPIDGIKLEVEHPKKIIIVGDRVAIVCSADVIKYKREITFIHNGKNLQQSDSVQISYPNNYYAWQARIDIDSVQHKHDGKINCKVKNIYGIYETHVINLQVLDPVRPMLVSGKSYETLAVDQNSALWLECDVFGTPEPDIVWLKNGAPMVLDKASNHVQLTRTNLSFEYLHKNDMGNYECHAENRMGRIEKFWNVKLRKVEAQKVEAPWSNTLIVTILCLILLLNIVAISLFYCKKVKEIRDYEKSIVAIFQTGDMSKYNSKMFLYEQADLLPYVMDYEFPGDQLKIGKQLGKGAFGVVLEATASRILSTEDETTVAIKMLHKNSNKEQILALISELKIMVHLGQHLNVVNLLGAVTKNIAKRKLMVIVEYCKYGNILNFLQRYRPFFVDRVYQNMGEIGSSTNMDQTRKTTDDETKEQDEAEDLDKIPANEPLQRTNIGEDKAPPLAVNSTDLVSWAAQIACGMEYLASRKVLHGDLAARNVLLCDNKVVKICDFGLSKSIIQNGTYKQTDKEKVPYKWLALECISEKVFSTYSDVWAYGIVLWEMFSLGEMPYPGMEANQELYNKLRDGYRMDKPQYSNQDIYDIMLNCWYVKPDTRPSFSDLRNKFHAMLPEETQQLYMDLNDPYLTMNIQNRRGVYVDYLAGQGPPDEYAPAVPDGIM